MSTPKASRASLRQQLLEKRRAWARTAASAPASLALEEHLLRVLQQLEPQTLGVYWAIHGEFNPLAAIQASPSFVNTSFALPYAQRDPALMHYRLWDRQPPTVQDECGIPSSLGAPLVPEVILLPCVGFQRGGYRLGYGGGYFDRWLQAHHGVTTVGLAWSQTLCDFAPEPHDQALDLIITELGVFEPS